MRDGWSQRVKSRYERRCSCGRIFYCSGACKSKRLEHADACWCPDCARRNLGDLPEVRLDIKEYRGLSAEEIYRRCYGYEELLESEG